MATLTTVLSSIAIARAKHIVSSTTTFSRAFSPSNPSNVTADPFSDARAVGATGLQLSTGIRCRLFRVRSIGRYRRIDKGTNTARMAAIQKIESTRRCSKLVVGSPVAGSTGIAWSPSAITRARLAQ